MNGDFTFHPHQNSLPVLVALLVFCLLLQMNLYFVPNDPEKTVLVSTNGIAHYRITTTKAGALRSPAITRISRPADTASNSLVGEIEWRRGWGSHAIARSNVFDGVEQKIEIRELLYKVGSTFST